MDKWDAAVYDLIAYYLLVALLFAGSAGWGSALLSAIGRSGRWPEARTLIGPPLQIALGVALFLVVGGFLVAANWAWYWCLLGWHVLGAGLLGLRAIQLHRARAMKPQGTRASRMLTGLVCAYLALVTLGFSIATFGYNPNDDVPAYMYLAVRILQTGGMIDPFSFRRIEGYNASRLYDALFWQASGSLSLNGFELGFSLLLVVFMVVRHARRGWLPLGLLVLGLGVLLGHGISYMVNLSPVFSAAALTLGVYQLLAVLPRDRPPPTPLLILIGLLLAGLISLRSTFLVAPGFAVLGVYSLLLRRHAIRAVLWTGCVSAAGIAGWAIAAYRSSGTPLFPIVSGNYRSSFLEALGPASKSLGAYLYAFWPAFLNLNVGVIGAVALVIAVVWIAAGSANRTGFIALAAAGLGTIVQLAVIIYLFSGIGSYADYRYQVATSFACAVFAIDLLWPNRHSEQSDISHRRLAASAVAAVAMALTSFGPDPMVYLRGVRSETADAARVLSKPSSYFYDPFASLRSEYSALSDAVPRGAKVLAAVEYPELLDFSRFQFATVDYPGVASPPPGLPIFGGPMAVVTYLRGLGYRYLVVDAPTSSGLYAESQWQPQLGGPPTYRSLALDFTAWNRDVTCMEHRKLIQVRRFGGLWLIPLH